MEEMSNSSANHVQLNQKHKHVMSEEIINMDDLQQPPLHTNEIDLVLNLETRFQQLLTELQMYRAGMVQTNNSDPNMATLQQLVAVSKVLADQAERKSNKATATAQRLAEEYDAEAKKSAVLQMNLRIAESECELLRSKVREQVCSNEGRSRQEIERQARLVAHDLARAQFERQLTRLQKTIDVLQRNHQRMESDMRKLEVEMSIARGQHEQMQQSQQRHRKRLENTAVKLQKAYAEIARLSARGSGEEKLQDVAASRVELQMRQRERELQQQLAEERAIAEALREALATAAAAQAGLVTLLGDAKQHQQFEGDI